MNLQHENGQGLEDLLGAAHSPACTRQSPQNGRTDLLQTWNTRHLGATPAVLMWKVKFQLNIQVDFNYHSTAHYTA